MPRPYQIFLIRHGVAEERGEAWPDDTKRPLTPGGTSRMEKAARGLARLDITFDVILSSPLVRARQTADIIAARAGGHPPIVNTDALAPGSDYAAVVAALEKHVRKGRIALVGHEPGIGELAARLIGSRHAVEFKKGGVCRIDLDEIPPTGPGNLRWMVPPRFLRAVRK
jgi:phosphohistidine phosphatase